MAINAEKILINFKKKIDPKIETYLNTVISETKNRDLFTAEALGYVKKTLLNGGKRLRPAFMYYGYLAAGGKNYSEIMKTSLSIELIHTFLLIHDDIIDKDNMRHGIDTVNFHYKKIGETIMEDKEENQHFGNSMAILVGDMIGALGNQILYNSKFNPKLVVKALKKLQTIVADTVIGETRDILMQYEKNNKEKDVLKMYEYKTAKYTIEGPLHLGAILAGAGNSLLRVFSQYAIPVGIAFQIQDDILGVFGSEKKIGKPVGSDISEGKKTLLVVKALELGRNKQKDIIKRYLGKKQITDKEIDEFKTAVVDSGSLEYCQKLAIKMANKGKDFLKNEKISDEAEKFLAGITDYIIRREI